jgi:hypothetical protein
MEKVNYAEELSIIAKRYPSIKTFLRNAVKYIQRLENKEYALFELAPVGVIGAFIREDRGIHWIANERQYGCEHAAYTNTGWKYVEKPMEKETMHETCKWHSDMVRDNYILFSTECGAFHWIYKTDKLTKMCQFCGRKIIVTNDESVEELCVKD